MKVVYLLLLLSFYICIASGTNSEEESVSSQQDESYLSSIVEQMDELTIGDRDGFYGDYEKRTIELNTEYIKKSTELWEIFTLDMDYFQPNDIRAYERYIRNFMNVLERNNEKYIDLGEKNIHDKTRLEELLVEYEQELLNCYNGCTMKIKGLYAKQSNGDALEAPNDGNSNDMSNPQ